jgi:hypothetical protein
LKVAEDVNLSAVVRCFHRQSVVSYYTPHSAAITVRLDAAVASQEAITHELVHHDLTEATLAGMLDQLLGRGAADPLLASADRERLQAGLERSMVSSGAVHEATATYVAALGERAADRRPIPLDELPSKYRDAVRLYLQIPLDDPYGTAPVSFLANQSLAISCARAALDSPNIRELLRARPRSADELLQILLSVGADRIFLELASDLGRHIVALQEVVVEFSKRRFGIADPRRLDAWMLEPGRVAEFHPDLMEALAVALHEMFPPLLGVYASPAQKAGMWADFVRHCQTSIFDQAHRAYFADIAVTGALGNGIDPDFVYLFPSIRFDKIWRLVRSPPVQRARDAIAWFHAIIAITGPRGLRVVLHGREFFNERDTEQELSSGELVQPRGGVMHFDLQLDRVKADGGEITTEDVLAVSVLPQSVSADWRTKRDEEDVYAAIEELWFPIVWHAGWLQGFGAAMRDDAYRERPGRTVFYLDQSGATGRLFDRILAQLTAESPRDVIRADLFDGASDAYVIPFNKGAWCVVFPAISISKRLEDFNAAHPGRVRPFLERDDAMRVDPLVRYGIHYVYNLVKES